jgi:signal transduction histidine kinase
MEGRTLLLCGLLPETAQGLRAQGHLVEEAGDGYRAVELAERVHPAAVVARAELRGPGPAEVIRRVRAAVPATVLLMVLDEPGSYEAASLLRAGADGVLRGEPDPGFLSWALAQAMDGGVVLAPGIARELVTSLTESVIREREWARALAERAQQAEELARAKSDFVGNVSHELRTPLTIIKGVAATLARAPASEIQAQLLTEVEAAADKLAGMVETILTQAEMARGEFRLDFQPCDVAEIVRDGVEEVGGRYGNLTIELTAPPSMPAIADSRALRGVVRQLTDNACRYSAEGGRVTVRAHRSDEGISVHFTDTGPGVRRGQISAAFGAPFSPGEEIMTKMHAGLGLGLNVARSLLALHGGILWAEPLPGGGSRVSFTIPAEGPPAATQPEAPATASTSS